MEDNWLEDSYCMRHMEHYLNLVKNLPAHEGHRSREEEAKSIRKLMAQREAVNAAAMEMIDEQGLGPCSAMAVLKAEKDPRLIFVLNVGWAVDGFAGVASFLNNISAKACDAGNFEKAVMLRMFAICALQNGIAHVDSEEVDEILTEVYSLKIEMPNQDEWNEAAARDALEEAETEFLWQESQKGKEENDDELD